MGQTFSIESLPPTKGADAKIKPKEVSDVYLAKPSGACCLKGTLHEGESHGRWETIEGVETYIATPQKGKANGNVLLYFPDVWGMFPNGLLVMDAFAEAGYLVLGLDYFRGVRTRYMIVSLSTSTRPSSKTLPIADIVQDPVWKHRKDRNDHSQPDFDYEAWKLKHMTFADEAVPRWVDAVAQRYKSEKAKFVCVGYCFGAPYVCSELAKGLVTAGAFAHPAFLKEHHFSNIESKSFLPENIR
jgi:dienelactone hydrolase